jgi:chromate transporter
MEQIKLRSPCLLRIFFVFFRIGAFTFGGGYAMIPLIEVELADKQNWFEKREIIDIIAVSQCGPGAIAVNSATYIGRRLAGTAGSIVATLGVTLPSFIVILVIAALFGTIEQNPLVQGAFRGFRPAVVALVLSSALRLGRQSLTSSRALIIMVVALILSLLLQVHPVLLLCGGGVVGYFLGYSKPQERKDWE